jgi:hypothetical protein
MPDRSTAVATVNSQPCQNLAFPRHTGQASAIGLPAQNPQVFGKHQTFKTVWNRENITKGSMETLVRSESVLPKCGKRNMDT